MSWFAFKPYVPVAQRQKDVRKKIAELRKTTKMSPVVLSGRKITTTWWD